ncbi:MAG: helix-turn-helix domain-containing protein [Sedimentisphaerales bacterium]|nr:helix-turn-helix domain-containing protein [Sedimentisphaerales bacterium]
MADVSEQNKMKNRFDNPKNTPWPQRPEVFPDLMTPVEAAMFLRLDQTIYSPESACRTLNYWRDRGELRATKFARHVWYLKRELEKFLENKTEEGV